MSAHLIWYTARSAGLVSWALLCASMLWGLTLSTRRLRRWTKPAWVLDLHRFLGAATIVFVAVHVLALSLDTYVHFGLSEILVPFASKWHPAAVAWGVVGIYLLAAVEITSLIRARLRRSLWRKAHYLTLPLFVVATIHGLSAGTDRHAMVVITGAVAGCVAVAGLVAFRVASKLSRLELPRAQPRNPEEDKPARNRPVGAGV